MRLALVLSLILMFIEVSQSAKNVTRKAKKFKQPKRIVLPKNRLIPKLKATFVHQFIKAYDPTEDAPREMAYSELNLLSEMLIDITLSKCAEVLPKELSEMKHYFHRQLSNAPLKPATNSTFMTLYGSLLTCFEKMLQSTPALEKDARKNTVEGYTQQEFFDFFPRGYESDIGNQDIFLHDSPNVGWKIEIPEYKEETSTSTTSTSTKKPIEEEKMVEKSKIMNNVGHLFNTLYDNTISIFSTLFERKKRQTSNLNDIITEQIKSGKDKKNKANKDEKYPDEWESQVNPKQKYYANDKANRIQQIVFDSRPQDLKDVWAAKLPPEEILRQKKEKDGITNFLKNSRSHFNRIVDSMVHIVKNSCPKELDKKFDFFQSAVIEMFSYVDEDLVKRSKNEQKFKLNRRLQEKIERCNSTVKANY